MPGGCWGLCSRNLRLEAGQTDPDLMELVWLHTALVFMEGCDKGKGLQNFPSTNEHNCGLVMWEVLVSSFAVCFNFKHRYGLNLELRTQ